MFSTASMHHCHSRRLLSWRNLRFFHICSPQQRKIWCWKFRCWKGRSRWRPARWSSRSTLLLLQSIIKARVKKGKAVTLSPQEQGRPRTSPGPLLPPTRVLHWRKQQSPGCVQGCSRTGDTSSKLEPFQELQPPSSVLSFFPGLLWLKKQLQSMKRKRREIVKQIRVPALLLMFSSLERSRPLHKVHHRKAGK